MRARRGGACHECLSILEWDNLEQHRVRTGPSSNSTVAAVSCQLTSDFTQEHHFYLKGSWHTEYEGAACQILEVNPSEPVTPMAKLQISSGNSPCERRTSKTRSLTIQDPYDKSTSNTTNKYRGWFVWCVCACMHAWFLKRCLQTTKSKSIDRNYQMTRALWYLLYQRFPQTQDHTQTAEKRIDSISDSTRRNQSLWNNSLSTRAPWEADSGPHLGIDTGPCALAAPPQYAQTKYRRKQGSPTFPLKKKTEQCLTSPSCEWQFWV